MMLYNNHGGKSHANIMGTDSTHAHSEVGSGAQKRMRQSNQNYASNMSNSRALNEQIF